MSTAKRTPGPWKRSCFLIQAQNGDWICHTGQGNLPPSRSAESEANAAFIVKACNAHDDLVAALKALREAVETSKTMEGREYVDLGIQVNNALAKAGVSP